MQWLAQLLPFTHALEGMRQAIQAGTEIADLVQYYLALSVFIVVLMPLSWALFAYAVRKTRETGSLGHY
jgi:ABC-type polysaccharide/polyol phosphate export permease